MDLSYHITFTNGSNSYYSFPADAKKQIKDINKWILNHYVFKCDILAKGYRINNTSWGTWVVYKIGKWVDTPEKEYRHLGNAVTYIEKIMEE